MALTTRGTLQAASPSTAEATTNRATVLDELRQRCVEVAPSSEQVVAPAPGYGVSLGKTVAARQPRPSCAAASPALQTMAPADVFTAVFSCAVPACPKPHNAATVSKHDSSGPYRWGGGFTLVTPRLHRHQLRGLNYWSSCCCHAPGSVQQGNHLGYSWHGSYPACRSGCNLFPHLLPQYCLSALCSSQCGRGAGAQAPGHLSHGCGFSQAC